MTRHQQRLNAAYAKNPCQATQDAVIGHALYRRNQARLTPAQRAIRERGYYATARQMRNLGVDFIDAYVAIFGVMPNHV